MWRGPAGGRRRSGIEAPSASRRRAITSLDSRTAYEAPTAGGLPIRLALTLAGFGLGGERLADGLAATMAHPIETASALPMTDAED